MRIFSPVSNPKITQRFGENLACRNNETGAISYKQGGVCPVGAVDFYDAMGLKGHPGIDFEAYVGQPLYFSTNADIEWIAEDASDWSGGLGVDIRSKQPVWFETSEGLGPQAIQAFQVNQLYVKFRYWHLSQAWPDQDVKLGEQIGLCGNTGSSSAPHLHMVMKFCDKDGTIFDEDNGYMGAVDFEKYFHEQFVLDLLGRKEKLSWTQWIKKLFSFS